MSDLGFRIRDDDEVPRPAPRDRALDDGWGDELPLGKPPDVAEISEPEASDDTQPIADARAEVQRALDQTKPVVDDSADRVDLPIPKHAIADRTTSNRIDLADDVDRAVDNTRTYDGYLDVVMHGDANGTQADIGYREDFTLEQTAAMIEASPAWDDRPIRLMSCSTGQADYAQDLANRLQVPVYSPSDILKLEPDGSMSIDNDGTWRRFEPML